MSRLKYTIRQLAKSPGFTAVAVLTLGLCIGASLTIFAVLDAIVVRSLPFPEPGRLVIVNNAYPGAGVERGNASFANYFERRGSIEAFESVSMSRELPGIVGRNGSARLVDTLQVTPEFFETLGVPLALGQTFTDSELVLGSDLVSIISDQFWRNYFNADPKVVGRAFPLNSVPVRVIGVLPPQFRYLSSKAQIYRPLSYAAWELDFRHRNVGPMIARLAANRSMAEAEAQLSVLNAQLRSEDPQGETTKENGFHTWVDSLHEDHVRSVKPVLLLLQAGALCLLLIGAANLAGLLLIRASGQMKEVAVRKALGANRWQITNTSLTETLFLSLVGGICGGMLALLGIKLTEALGIDALPLGAEIAFDERTAMVSILASIIVGSCIALPIIWLNLRDTTTIQLQSESRAGTMNRAVQRLRHGFIVSQIAIAFVLLCGAGLLSVSLKRTLDVDPGFEAEQVVTGEISLPKQIYPDDSARLPFLSRLLDRLQTLPGVKYAAVTNALPFTAKGAMESRIRPEGFDPAAGSGLRAHYHSWVSPDYWRAMNIPLLQGRYFRNSDLQPRARDEPGVAVIDSAVAQQYWPDGDALGRRFSLNPLYFNEESIHTYTVVGIVDNVKQTDLTDTRKLGVVYVPNTGTPRFRILLRTLTSASAMAPTMQRILSELDPNVPCHDFRTLQSRIDDTLVTRRSPAILAGVFSVVALLLASIGIYGALAYAVAQRRREIGVRMALGAFRQQIGRQFLTMGLRLFALGTLIGLAGAWVAGGVMQGVLFEVPSLHLPTLVGTVIVMSFVTLIACLLPAMRAIRVDPIEALRSG